MFSLDVHDCLLCELWQDVFDAYDGAYFVVVTMQLLFIFWGVIIGRVLIYGATDYQVDAVANTTF